MEMPEGLVNTLGLAFVAIINLIGVYITYKSRLDILETKFNVVEIEKATNSMKDALVQKTGEASFSAGKEEARLEAETKASNVLASVKAEEIAKAEGKAEALESKL